MEIELVLPGLNTDSWLVMLREALNAVPAGQGILAEEILGPPGTLGAVNTRKARVKGEHLDTLAKIAAIVGAGASLYAAMSPTPSQCEIGIITKEAQTVMTYDCKHSDPVQIVGVVTSLLNEGLKHHIEKHGAPQQIKLTPRHGRTTK